MATKKTSRKETPDRTEDAGSFELSLSELQRIVAELEGGELDLTASLECYEVGIRRLKECHQFLDSAQQRVSQLVGFDSEGNPVTADLETTGQENLDEKQQARQQRRSSGSASRKSGGTARSEMSLSQEASSGDHNSSRQGAGSSSRSSVDDSPELF